MSLVLFRHARHVYIEACCRAKAGQCVRLPRKVFVDDRFTEQRRESLHQQGGNCGHIRSRFGDEEFRADAVRKREAAQWVVQEEQRLVVSDVHGAEPRLARQVSVLRDAQAWCCSGPCEACWEQEDCWRHICCCGHRCRRLAGTDMLFLKTVLNICILSNCDVFQLKATTSNLPSLASMFKKEAGSWDCDTCMVTNKGDAIKCIACETLKPGATAVSSEYTRKIL